MRRVPILPTLLVLAAVAMMIGLGVWQLQRKAWKEALIARYAGVEAQAAPVAWPRDPAAVEAALFRHADLTCEQVLSTNAVAGRSASGTQGLAQVAHCRVDGGGTADIWLGWSTELLPNTWSGGRVRGLVAPGVSGAARLIADPPLAGLQPLARPDPRDLPNNHLAYAVQWFLFAAVAAVIYALALRKRMRSAV